jgi:hypothetical protein
MSLLNIELFLNSGFIAISALKFTKKFDEEIIGL